ncbi:MAG: hypothetical protein JXA78_17430 [Anaerolineales bacterium]|nr:hypothetical protein [Anaerolineales bacterium]
MRKWKHSQIVRAALGFVGLPLLIGAIVLSIKTLPQSTTMAYPPPEMETPSIIANITNTPDQLKPTPPSSSIPTLASDEFSFYNRPAEVGTIIETGYSSLPSTYKVVNQWFAEFDNKKFFAYAGAQVNDPAKGGKALPKPWPSILILEVTTTDGEQISEENGKYETETNSGQLRIIDANHDEIHLVTREGKVFIFDLKSKTFSVPKSSSIITRQLGEGAIWETGNAPISTNDYTFQNYWYLEKGSEQVYVFAGVMNADPAQGVLVKYSIKPEINQTTGLVYFTPVKDGSNRIVDLIDGKLIIITLSGLEYGFSVLEGKIYTFDHTKIVFTPLDTEDLVEPIPFQEDKFDPFASPTITITHTPSITPLPSLTPLPYP